MKAVLLAGGYGKRLEPLTLSTPKCLLPVACKPNLAYVLELLEGVPGITEVVLSTNEVQAGMLRAALKEMSQDKVKVVVEKTTSNENKLGAVKAIKYVFDEVGYDDAVIIGSDNFIHGLDLKDVVGKFRKEKASAAIILHELEDERLVEKLGIAVLDSKNNVSFFQEKPKLSEAKSRLASTAIYCVSKRFLDGALGKYIAEKESSGEKPDNLGDLWAHSLKTEKIL
ncbi:MAG TPA: nucleotidyltransferase family protein, partial [archaeon]|nr:nucleotidyltransferase family protein [archaeon]